MADRLTDADLARLKALTEQPTGFSVATYSTRKVRALIDEVEAARAQRIPGAWVCNTCGFTAQKMTLRATDGAVGVDARDVQDICPNDGTSLRPLTWREDAEASGRVAEQLLARAVQAEQALAAEREGRSVLEIQRAVLIRVAEELQAAKDAAEARAVAAEVALQADALVPTSPEGDQHCDDCGRDEDHCECEWHD